MTDFGIFTFATDYSMAPARIAAAVEERGFESLFLPEHTHIPTSRQSPYPGGGELPKEYSHTHDVFVALTAAACATKTLKLATGICLITEHHPIQLAKTIASIDQLSEGRLILGIGAGWNAEEMAHHDVVYKDRWKVLRERMLAMRTIWREDEAQFYGDYVNFEPIWSYPKPSRPEGPPVLLGASSKWVFDRIAEYGDGWMPIIPFPGRAHAGVDLQVGLDTLSTALEARGRSMSEMDLTAFGLGPNHEQINSVLELGFNRVVFAVPPGDDAKMLRLMDKYAKLVDTL
ncbi:MAG: LLM class F420-dependent oxidoreductase [Gammaproteobacteria bacterium]|nr:LLM class F420-dependent oxidoreductase [Gammaproteobacteria bacterium]